MILPYFNWSSYWGTWSRVLHSPGKKHDNCELPSSFQDYFIEIDLTPVNGWPREEDDAKYSVHQLDQVRHINIRCHGTSRGKKDKTWGDLPEMVREAMLDNLGYVLTQRLLIEDFLPQIDFSIYHKHCNGGAKLADIRRQSIFEE
jgi:hypothetical protein